MKWVTREKPKVDRVACPWLIKNFVDQDAEFLFVPSDMVLETAEEKDATPFDIPDVELGHHDGQCTFEAIVAKYDLTDPGLHLLSRIVHGADTADHDYTPQSPGLRAISQGWHLLDLSLERRLEIGFAVYDCLYAWCKSETTG